MEDSRIGEFLESYAPADVLDTIAWLGANGYALASHRGESTFGAHFVYAGDAEVRITVDRSQWYLDVAPTPGSEAWQYDLLFAAHRDQEYAVLFPETGTRPWGEPLPDKLPVGVSWRETLPEILQWISGHDVQAAVDRALHQRYSLMWPRQDRK